MMKMVDIDMLKTRNDAFQAFRWISSNMRKKKDGSIVSIGPIYYLSTKTEREAQRSAYGELGLPTVGKVMVGKSLRSILDKMVQDIDREAKRNGMETKGTFRCNRGVHEVYLIVTGKP